MHSAVWKARESRCAAFTGRPAARRKTITARAVPVRCGTIRSFARASRPPTVITRGRIPCQQSQFRSGWRCKDDQLTLMSMTWPKRTSKTETNSVSSCEISPVRGHHAPSILFPSRDARVSRTRLDRAPRPYRIDHAWSWLRHRASRPLAPFLHRVYDEVCHWILLRRNDTDRRFCALHGQPFAVRNDQPDKRADGGIALPVISMGYHVRGQRRQRTALWRRYATILLLCRRGAALGSPARTKRFRRLPRGSGN